MFDIGFWELLLIGVVALLIVGPDRFPGMVRGAGIWVGKFRQMASNVKEEIKTEVESAEQLQRLAEEQKSILKRTQDEFNEAVDDLEKDVSRPRPVPLSSGAPSLNKQQQVEEEKAHIARKPDTDVDDSTPESSDKKESRS